MLDSENQSIYRVIRWAKDKQRYKELYTLIRGVRYYYYVRGLWDIRLDVDLIHFHAACESSDRNEAILALAYYLSIVSRQHNRIRIEEYLPQLRERLKEAGTGLPSSIRYVCEQAIAMCLMVDGKFDEAEHLWRSSQQANDLRMRVAASRWITICLYKTENYSQAIQLITHSLNITKLHGFMRATLLHYLDIAKIYLLQGNHNEADKHMSEAQQYISPTVSYMDQGEIHYVQGWIYILMNKKALAREELNRSIDLFRRMEMQYELKEAVRLLNRIDDT